MGRSFVSPVCPSIPLFPGARFPSLAQVHPGRPKPNEIDQKTSKSEPHKHILVKHVPKTYAVRPREERMDHIGLRTTPQQVALGLPKLAATDDLMRNNLRRVAQ